MALNRIRCKEAMLLHARMGTQGSIPGLSRYTGTGRPLGDGAYNNTPLAASQIAFAMAMSRHPLVEDLIRGVKGGRRAFDGAELEHVQMLCGMRILDLGCGRIPGFARCARALGAKVFTADRIGALEFVFSASLFGKESRQVEIESHFQVDLERLEAAHEIGSRTGGGFDLVSEANLKADGCLGGRMIATALLRPGGIYYDPPGAEAWENVSSKGAFARSEGKRQAGKLEMEGKE